MDKLGTKAVQELQALVKNGFQNRIELCERLAKAREPARWLAKYGEEHELAAATQVLASFAYYARYSWTS